MVKCIKSHPAKFKFLGLKICHKSDLMPISKSSSASSILFYIPKYQPKQKSLRDQEGFARTLLPI